MKDHTIKKEPNLDAVYKKGLERFETIQKNELEQRELSVEDRRFCDTEDGQWSDVLKKGRKNRPRFTINKTAPIIDQVTGDQKQNDTSAKVRPLKDGKKDIADIYQGIIRTIETQSQAKNIYDQSFEETVKGGYGGWRIVTEFNEFDIFQQDIKLKPINSADTSLYFGPAESYDKRDAKFAFLISSMTIDEFNATNPDAKPISFDNHIYSQPNSSNWFDGDTMLVAEYWVKEPYTMSMGLLSDGRVIDLEEEKQVLDELLQKGITIVKTRKVESHKVFMYKMNGAEIYSEKQEFASKFIPLVPEYGHISKIENKTYVRGMIRFAKDANRIYNSLVSNDIETQALTPKDPYWYTPAMVKGFKHEYENFPSMNLSFMPFNPDPDAGGGPPQRTGAPSVNQAAAISISRASLDIDAAMGFFGPAKGDAPQMLSEKSVIAQAEKGDRGVYIYQDNLLKSKQYTYEILVDMIPRIYDQAQQIRILGEDGSTSEIGINQTVFDKETKENVLINDLSQGKYEVVAKTGPAFATKRMETTDQLLKLAAEVPIFADIVPDLIAKNIDVNESEEMFARIREVMINNGMAKPTDEEVKELGLDAKPQMSESDQTLNDNVLMQTEKTKSEIELNDEKADTERQNRILKSTQTYKELLGAFKLQQELGIQGGISEVELLTAQQGIIQISQDQSVEVEEIDNKAEPKIENEIGEDQLSGINQQLPDGLTQ